MVQEIEHKIWKIIVNFYKSSLAFQQLRDCYEEKVIDYSKKRNIPREELKLSPTNLAGLIEFHKLENLRDRYLTKLKSYCHEIFRGHNQTDLLDRYVSDIFHEISILKEEHYTVKHYATIWANEHAEIELKTIMEEAFEVFPRKIHHITFLFKKARDRIEKLLPNYQNHKILVRSLFLNRHGFVSSSYPRGLISFYNFIFPVNGAIEGYYKVGLSFLNSSFYQKAIEAFKEGIEYSYKNKTPSASQKKIMASIRLNIKKAENALHKTKQANKTYNNKSKTKK